ncbi:MAG: hypothetical protein AAF721_09625 [Myxococcota bacterium]
MVPWAVALLGMGACTEKIDETGSPVGVESQRRTEIQLPCEDGESGCVEAVEVESAESKDPDVLDVVEFGTGFVTVEGVGEGKTSVIAKGNDKRFKITYAVEAGTADLQVDEIGLELAP